MSDFEQIGFIPRSIVRTFQRFFKQIGLKTDAFAIYEFRVSRYIAIASLQCFFFLFICPWVFHFFFQIFVINVINPILEAKFASPAEAPLQIPLFLNLSQQERAFLEIQTFSEQMYFETLLKIPGSFDSDRYAPLFEASPSLTHSLTEQVYQTYFLKCANFYHQQSLSIITNWVLDLMTALVFSFLLIYSTPQILILKTFFIESLLSLSETTKCFFLIFFLDLLVGFHSSKSWEIFLQFVIEHFGFQIHPNQNFIFFFISTFPVLLDTIFKYWIFRYLNKISPSTVATYQAMIE